MKNNCFSFIKKTKSWFSFFRLYSTIAEDHLNHLTVFPSLKPTSRNEVVQLKHTMDALLKRVGADVIDQKGPTQVIWICTIFILTNSQNRSLQFLSICKLHNLLEIIKQEQDIYNIVFHEIIRQVWKDFFYVSTKIQNLYKDKLWPIHLHHQSIVFIFWPFNNRNFDLLLGNCWMQRSRWNIGKIKRKICQFVVKSSKRNQKVFILFKFTLIQNQNVPKFFAIVINLKFLMF